MKSGKVGEIFQTERLFEAIVRLEMAKLKALQALEKVPPTGMVGVGLDEEVQGKAKELLESLRLAQNDAEFAAGDLQRAISSVSAWLKGDTVKFR